MSDLRLFTIITTSVVVLIFGSGFVLKESIKISYTCGLYNGGRMAAVYLGPAVKIAANKDIPIPKRKPACENIRRIAGIEDMVDGGDEELFNPGE